MKHKYLLLLIFSLVLLSCDSDDLKAPVPAYLTIEDIEVKSQEGDSLQSDNITDAKVFINGQSLGIFDLPATIPIQKTGPVNLKVRAGILKNGISNDKKDYPFYTTYEENILFEKEKEVYRKPKVEYHPTVNFDYPWSGEDFEGSGINFSYHPSSDVDFTRETNPNEVFEGVVSGAATLNANEDFFEAWIYRLVDVPRLQDGIYLEFNYKSTHEFIVSIYTNNESTQLPIVHFRPRTDWTKVYVDVGSIFSLLFTANNYTIAIGYTKEVGETGKLLVDNVKLVHF